MKRSTRIAIIGVMHTTLYLGLIPFVIVPKFGDSGRNTAIAIVVSLSLVILFSAAIGKKERNAKTSDQGIPPNIR